jgi:DNA-binding transcriptional LysR family regulator
VHTATLIVASADYIRRHGRPDSPETLRHHQCLTYPRGPQSPQWTFESREQPAERVSVKVQGPFATNNSESLRDAVLAGLGIALLPDFSAREAIGRGLVQELLPAGGRWRFCAKAVRHPALCTARVARGRDIQPLPEDLQRAAPAVPPAPGESGKQWRFAGQLRQGHGFISAIDPAAAERASKSFAA